MRSYWSIFLWVITYAAPRSDLILPPFAAKKLPVACICLFAVYARVPVGVEGRKRVVAPNIFWSPGFNERFQRIEIRSELRTAFSATPPVLAVAGVEQPGGVGYIGSAGIVDVLHNRVVLILRVRIQHTDQAEVDADDLVQLQHLLGQPSVIEVPGACPVIG